MLDWEREIKCGSTVIGESVLKEMGFYCSAVSEFSVGLVIFGSKSVGP